MAAIRQTNKVMIIKPPNYYCGIGIKLINNTGQTLNPPGH